MWYVTALMLMIAYPAHAFWLIVAIVAMQLWKEKKELPEKPKADRLP